MLPDAPGDGRTARLRSPWYRRPATNSSKPINHGRLCGPSADTPVPPGTPAAGPPTGRPSRALGRPGLPGRGGLLGLGDRDCWDPADGWAREVGDAWGSWDARDCWLPVEGGAVADRCGWAVPRVRCPWAPEEAGTPAVAVAEVGEGVAPSAPVGALAPAVARPVGACCPSP